MAKSAKLLQFPHATVSSPKMTGVRIPLSKLDTYEGVKLLSKMMRDWERSKKEHTYKLLAQRANLHPKTVSRIAAHETFSPKLHTVLMIFTALGFVAMRLE